MMERKHTAVFFLTAIALLAFGIILFMIPGGSILTADDNGDFIYDTLRIPLIAYGACILGFLGIITLLRDIIEPSLWFSVGALLFIAGLIGYFLNMMMFIGLLVSLAFGGWFLLAGIRSLIASWYDYEPWLNILVAVCRVAASVAIFSYAIVWLAIPTTMSSPYDPYTFEQIMADPATQEVCIIAGALSIAAAIGVAIEAILWIKTLDE